MKRASLDEVDVNDDLALRPYVTDEDTLKLTTDPFLYESVAAQ